MKKLLIKYKELIMYGIFGVGATLINIVTFHLFYNVIHASLLVSNIVAWVFAFIFAFVTNKLFVFESKSWEGQKARKEFFDFLLTRLATLVVDTVLIWLFIDVLKWDSIVSKIIDNVVVIVINYVASKFWIFAKKKQ
jgi:putative flippase GtrA